MTYHRTWFRAMRIIAPAAMALLVSACGPTPSAPNVVGPLPARATCRLNNLTPPVARPQNRPYEHPLPDEAVRAVREAQALQEAKRFSAAADQLQQALRFDPNHPVVHEQLGMAYASMSHYEKAKKHLRTAEAHLGDDVRLQVLLGQLAHKLRRTEEAILHFRTALLCHNAQPDNPQAAYALLVLGQLLEEEGYWTASLECFDRLEEWMDRHDRVYESDPLLRNLVFRPEKRMAMRGHLLDLLGQDDRAVPLLQAAYRRNRSDSQVAEWLFSALLHAKIYAPAETLLIDIAGQTSLQAFAPQMAEDLCRAGDDPAVPLRIWRAFRAKHEVSAPLAVALVRSARALGAPDEAQSILETLLQEIPDSVEGMRLLTELWLETAAPTEALRRLAEKMHTHPQSAAAVHAGVRVVSGMKNAPAVLTSFCEIAEKDTTPRAYALQYVAGLLAMDCGKTFQAADCFRRALREKKDFFPAYEALLDVCVSAGDIEALHALPAQYKQAVGEDYYYHSLLGRIRLREGKCSEAIDALEAARNANPSHVPTLSALAKAYLRQRRSSREEDVRALFRKQAEGVLQQAVRLTPRRKETYRTLFDLYVEQKKYDDAMELAEAFLERNPDRPEGMLMQVEAFLRAGQVKNAQHRLAQLTRRFPNDPLVRLLEVQAVVAQFPGVLPRPVYDTCLRRLERILQAYPNHDPTRRFLAQFLSQAVPGRYADAAEVWRRVYADSESSEDVGETLTAVLLRADTPVEAQAVVEVLLKRSSTDATFRLLLIDALTQAGRIDQAVAAIRRWWDEDKTNPAWVLLLLDLYEETGRTDDALRLLDDLRAGSVSLLPEETWTLKTITFLCQAGRESEAIRLAEEHSTPLACAVLTDELVAAEAFDLLIPAMQRAEKAATTDETRNAMRENLLYAYVSADRIDTALKTIDAWIRRIDPAASRPAEAHRQRTRWQVAAIRTLLTAGRYDDAQTRLRAYLAENPNDPELLNLQSTLLTEQGKPDEAIRVLERACKLRPKDTSYQNNLAYSLAEAGVDLSRAEKLIKSALQVEGPRSASADTLAWVYYKQGRLGESAEIFASILPDPAPIRPGRRRLAADDIHPIIWDHAGDVFYRLGWLDRAVRYWKQALRGARDEKVRTHEIRQIRDGTPTKLRAVKDKTLPAVAPLGKTAQARIDRQPPSPPPNDERK